MYTGSEVYTLASKWLLGILRTLMMFTADLDVLKAFTMSLLIKFESTLCGEASTPAFKMMASSSMLLAPMLSIAQEFGRTLLLFLK
jgi:hypothetical protein